MDDEGILILALLIPLTGNADSSNIAGAADLAIDRANNDKTLLPGRALELIKGDSGCSARQGLQAMGELLLKDNRIKAVLGPRCNSACRAASYLTGGQQMAQISWGKILESTRNVHSV